MNTIEIFPHGPLIARDGRPFGEGGQGHCVNWPYPSVVAGTLRTLIGKKIASGDSNPFQSKEFLDRLLNISITCPLPAKEEELFFPAPQDILVYKEDEKYQFLPLKPKEIAKSEGCNLPLNDLWPIDIPKECKPSFKYTYYSASQMSMWLEQNPPLQFLFPSPEEAVKAGFLEPFTRERRTNVCIESESYIAKQGGLFSTEGLVIPDIEIPKYKTRHIQTQLKIMVSAKSNDSDIQKALNNLKEFHPFGGERRLAWFSSSPLKEVWKCPPNVERAISNVKRVRMVLVSPAIFEHGWRPGWLNKNLEGSLPEASEDVRLKLTGAVVGRWVPISGWDLKLKGVKPVRRLVPSGSVYFFEVLSNNARALSKAWLQSVCDDPQDRRDGFGIALWGVWSC